MSTTQIKEEIHHFINDADEHFLKVVHALVKFAKNTSTEFELSEFQKTILDERKKKHLKGTSKSYSWEEVKKMARQ